MKQDKYKANYAHGTYSKNTESQFNEENSEKSQRKTNTLHVSSVQFSSVAQSGLTLCNPMNCSTPASLFITKSRGSPKPMYVELVMPSNHFILCNPLLLLPSILPSIRIFSNESALCIRWPKCWLFSFSNSPTNEHPGLISFRMDWLDLLAVQGTLQESSNTIVQKHQCFSAQFSL